MSELENSEVGEDAGESSVPGRRKPKMLLRYNTPSTWQAASTSEILLRTRPNEPRLFPCHDIDDSAATARALVAYADRINRNIEQYIEKQRQAQQALTGKKIEKSKETERYFAIQTAQCLIIYSDKQTQRDTLAHCIRCIVTKNVLYDMSLEYQRQVAELAAQAGVEEASSSSEPAAKRPRGRPRKSAIQPVPVGPAEIVKRGRGRPKKNQEQGTLV